MAVTITITEMMLFKALGDFITSLVDCPVVRGQVNRVPSIAGDSVVMSPLLQMALATTTETYTDTESVQAANLKRSTQWPAQIDCYGASANDRAAALAIALRSDYACQMFAATGLEIQPLYAGDPRQMPLITGEAQYQERWTFDAVLQFNPSISVPQDFADQLVVGLINVDVVYPPGP